MTWKAILIACLAIWVVASLIIALSVEPEFRRDLSQALLFIGMAPAYPVLWLAVRAPKMHRLSPDALMQFAELQNNQLSVWSMSYRQRGVIVLRRKPNRHVVDNGWVQAE